MATRDEVQLYTIAFAGIGFCSLGLFIFPSLEYEIFPTMLAFELWIATVVTSMGVWALMWVVQQRLEARI